MEVLAASASLHQDAIHPTTTTTTTTTISGSSSSGHGGNAGSSALEKRMSTGVSLPRLPRVNKISAGGIFGEAAFFLDLPQSVRCIALQPPHHASSSSATALSSSSSSSRSGGGSGGSSVIVLWTLDRTSYLTMETRHPQLCLLIQHALLKVSRHIYLHTHTNTNLLPCQHALFKICHHERHKISHNFLILTLVFPLYTSCMSSILPVAAPESGHRQHGITLRSAPRGRLQRVRVAHTTTTATITIMTKATTITTTPVILVK